MCSAVAQELGTKGDGRKKPAKSVNNPTERRATKRHMRTSTSASTFVA
jgi:hypothetical protein